MRRTVIIYGLAMAVLIALFKLVEYKFLVRDIPLEFYIGLVAVMFTGVGVWAVLKLTRPKIVEVSGPFEMNAANLTRTGISKREYEVLVSLAEGLSNQQIADKLFVSLNTVKTHSSNLFMKLDARRRTQAVRRAQELGLLP